MRKYYYLVLASLLALPMTFTSCSDDDDEGGSAKPANSVITTDDGDKVRLTKLGNYYTFDFDYDEEGRPVKIGDYDIDYDKGIIYSYEYKDDEQASFKLNGSGFVSYVNMEWEEYDDSSLAEKGNGTINLSYDGSGRLNKITANGSYNGTEDGEKYYVSESYTATFTYNNGKLTKIVWDGTTDEDGEKTKYKEIYTIEYEDAQENSLAQCTYSIGDIIGEYEVFLQYLYYVGMLGKPTSYLPTKISYEWYEDGEMEGHNSKAVSYSFNSDGTLKSETYQGTVYYTYSNVLSEAKAFVSKSPIAVPEKASRRHGFFRSRLNR